MKRNRGITLIALVVTIVVLLILAGISISMLGGENGIITKAQESKEENRGGAVEERRDLWIANIKTDENTGTKTAQELDEVLLELKKEGLLSDEDITYIKENGYIEIGSHFIDFRLDKTDGEIDWSKLEPGLYETGTTKMIKSWDELIRDRDIRVYENEFSGVTQELKGDLVISNEITAIGPELVSGQCGWIQGTKVTGVYIPDTVESIGYMAFAGFKYSKNINIPSSISEISEGAFYDCSSLTSIEIPNSVTSIGDSAFFGCSSLDSIKVEGDNTTYDSRDNCNAIIETNTNTLLYGCNNTIIPNSVTSIESDAFYECSSLTEITIPNSVTSIEGYAFSECTSLTSISIPNSVTSISNHAFYGCSNLTTVNYTGTKEQWNAIRIGSNNEDLENAKIICTDGEIN